MIAEKKSDQRYLQFVLILTYYIEELKCIKGNKYLSTGWENRAISSLVGKHPKKGFWDEITCLPMADPKGFLVLKLDLAGSISTTASTSKSLQL